MSIVYCLASSFDFECFVPMCKPKNQKGTKNREQNPERDKNSDATATARAAPAWKAPAVLYHIFDDHLLVFQKVLRVLSPLPSPLPLHRSRVDRGGILPAPPERQCGREG